MCLQTLGFFVFQFYYILLKFLNKSTKEPVYNKSISNRNNISEARG